MKRKLNTLFILISLALLAIIIFQVYWSVNAYRVNKTKFDTDIDVAMQKAMDDCKKDYYDSVLVVLVKRLSDTGTKITIDNPQWSEEIASVRADLQLNTWVEYNNDSLHYKTHVYHGSAHIVVSDKYTSQTINTTTTDLAIASKKINHKATLPELIAYFSFYDNHVKEQLHTLLGTEDATEHMSDLINHLKLHPEDSLLNHYDSFPYGLSKLPPNYYKADSIKLSKYLKIELNKLNIYTNYHLDFLKKYTLSNKPNWHYSETKEYWYQYHGFVAFMGITNWISFYARAKFINPQYAVLKGMLLPLCLSVFLILFTIYCFYYIIQLVIHQKKLAELKDDFINNMTHELKTPIATITVAIEGLQKFNALNDTEKTQRYLQTSRTELSRLNNLVTKVLNIAAFENKDIVLEKEKLNVDDMINEIISTEKNKSGKELNIAYINNEVKAIYVDKLHFRNVLVNIVDNAIKYTNEPVNITINCFKQAGNAVFAITDNGIGIPEQHISLVFDKFHRVPTGNVHNVKGTGLGLSYAKYIVTAHGGEIAVKSEINKGSEFIVSIPLSNG